MYTDGVTSGLSKWGLPSLRKLKGTSINCLNINQFRSAVTFSGTLSSKANVDASIPDEIEKQAARIFRH